MFKEKPYIDMMYIHAAVYVTDTYIDQATYIAANIDSNYSYSLWNKADIG